ncbi:MAG: 6-carboxytetrahydropterin synthase [Planctomycetota bacterium]
MHLLKRTVRCTFDTASPSVRGVNGYGGKPAMAGLGRYYEFEVACAGEPDPATGYLINIKDIDDTVRGVLPDTVSKWIAEGDPRPPTAVCAQLRSSVAGALEPVRLVSLRWGFSPTFSIEVDDMTTTAILRQRFDFAAAHRLHVPDLSDEDNRSMFGKCNNPNGHGHNYQVEPAVRVPLDGSLTLDRLERLTDETVIERFDHKHLNEDTAEFGPDGVNPSVENIARVCYELLAPVIEDAGGTLESMTVWETDRTCCAYSPGNG